MPTEKLTTNSKGFTPKHRLSGILKRRKAPEHALFHHARTLGNLIIRQGAEENYKPTLYAEPAAGVETNQFAAAIDQAVNQTLQSKFPGIELRKQSDNLWLIDIPEKYKEGTRSTFWPGCPKIS